MVSAIMSCGTGELGYTVSVCPQCQGAQIRGDTCGNRNCPSCGLTRQIQWRAQREAEHIYGIPYYHVVFTLPHLLTDLIIQNQKSLLDLLFLSASPSMLDLCGEKHGMTPGIVMVLHTCEGNMLPHYHIHCLISEGGYSDDGFWRNVKHFNYTFLRNAFRTALLNEMETYLGPSFKKIKASCYKNHKYGFYVYAKPNKCDPKTVTKYVGRYLGRPVIATSRIDKYDGDTVSFHYNRHEDDKYVKETVPVLDFIERLIRHIPEKHFKMIRYGGIYARHREIDKKLVRAISREQHPLYCGFNKWRAAILHAFGYDPLQCPECGSTMLFLELYYRHKRVSLKDMYEKVMSRSRGKWAFT